MTRIDNLTNFLTDVATAIKNKTGKTDAITPSNFDTEIASIQSGGGDTTQEDGLIEGTITSYSNNRVTSVREYTFSSYSTLTKIDLPKVIEIKRNGFTSCAGLKEANLPLLEVVRTYSFNGCSSLEKLDLPLLRLIDDAYCFRGTNLKTLILRRNTRCILGNSNSLTSTPIASKTGYIYVPDELVDSYKSATNWSAYADQIKPISELEGNQ